MTVRALAEDPVLAAPPAAAAWNVRPEKTTPDQRLAEAALAASAPRRRSGADQRRPGCRR